MQFALIDFETASACDLKKAGAWRYAEDPTTEILCLGYTIDGAKPIVREAPSLHYVHAPRDHKWSLEEAVDNPEVIFIAHNVAFEKAIWRNIMVPVFGWPDIPDERWHDTQASCAMKALPLNLDRAARVLRLTAQKDTKGSKSTVALSKPNKKTGMLDRSPASLKTTSDYCGTDIYTELELHRRVRGLGAVERKVWLLDQKINQRGVMLDTAYVRQAQKIVDAATGPLLKEFHKLTGDLSPASPKFLKWLQAQGCNIPNLQKDTIAEILGEQDDEEDLTDEDDSCDAPEPQFEMPFAYRRPLEIRAILGSASIKKLRAMQACVCADERARGLLQYHGTSTGLWAGRLLQPQNFPRPNLKVVVGFNADGSEKYGGHEPDQLVAAIMTGDHEYLGMMFGEPINAVSNGLRHAIIAKPGHLLESADLKQIQARIVLALAGQHDKTALMAGGATPYVPMAESIFKRKIDKNVDLKEYTIGKNTVLGCGFGMGAKKFLFRYCPKETIEYAQTAIDTYRQEFAPMVPKLWYALEDAANKTVWDRRSYEAYGIAYALEDGWLTCRLPSGRKLWHYDPQPVRKAMPWDKNDIRPGVTYGAWKMGQWIRVNSYGGLETQNVVSGIARDLLVNGMFNLEAAGHPMIFNVHDENIAEVPEDEADTKVIDQCMRTVPQWAQSLGIPAASDCWTGQRYRK